MHDIENGTFRVQCTITTAALKASKLSNDKLMPFTIIYDNRECHSHNICYTETR